MNETWTGDYSTNHKEEKLSEELAADARLTVPEEIKRVTKSASDAIRPYMGLLPLSAADRSPRGVNWVSVGC